jgi:hypothetical protein
MRKLAMWMAPLALVAATLPASAAGLSWIKDNYPKSIGGSKAPKPTYVRGSVGAMVIDVPPDAGSAGSRRSRWLRRTVCLA